MRFRNSEMRKKILSTTAPRLSDFQRQHLDMLINMATQTRPFLFNQTGFGTALYFGDTG